MTVLAPFIPSYTQGITVAPTPTSAASVLGDGAKSLCFTNLGGVACYVRISGDPAPATAADYVILPLTQIVLEKPQDFSNVSYVTAASTGSLHIMPGEGF